MMYIFQHFFKGALPLGAAWGGVAQVKPRFA